MLKPPVYLDNNATTPCDPRVVAAMLPFFTEQYGNAESVNHAFGRAAHDAIEQARRQVAACLGAHPTEIIFTGGATESNNIAIKGVCKAFERDGGHVITCCTEHKAVLGPIDTLKAHGFRVSCLEVDEFGRVTPEQVADAIEPDTRLISLMWANNEIGTLHPIAAIGRLAKARGVLFHTDAAQGVGKLRCRVDDLGVDLLSLSAHKLYGPKGVGALYVRRREPPIPVFPVLEGAGHERGLRSGTHNVPGIVGAGVACAVADADIEEEGHRLTSLRERLRTILFDGLEDIILNGHPTDRLPGNLNISVAGVEPEPLVTGLRTVALSSGSACSTGAAAPSRVLLAIGRTPEQAQRSLRMCVGRFTTDEEVDYAGEQIVKHVTRLRRTAAVAS